MNEMVYFLLFFACQCVEIPINHNDKCQVENYYPDFYDAYFLIMIALFPHRSERGQIYSVCSHHSLRLFV